MKIADIYNKEYKLNKTSPRFPNLIFPSIDSIYHKEFKFDNNSTSNHMKNIRKYSAYDSYSQYSHQKNEKVAEEEIEYVLVKEPSKKNRKWKPSQQLNKGEIKKRKRNYTLEDIQIPKQKNELSSPSSASTNSSNKKLTKKLLTRKKKLFNTSTQSRFDFVDNSNKDSECPEIPEFVHDIIYKITSSYSFFKQFDSNIVNDKEILSTEYNQVNSWNESMINRIKR